MLRSAPSSPHPRFFFFFFFPFSPCSPVVFPGRLCLAGDPFSQVLCGLRGPQSLGRVLPSAARALASVRLPGPQLRERGQRGVSGASAAILGSESLGARTVAGLARRGEALPAEPEESAHEKGICASRGWGSIQGWARPSRETLG